MLKRKTQKAGSPRISSSATGATVVARTGVRKRNPGYANAAGVGSGEATVLMILIAVICPLILQTMIEAKWAAVCLFIVVASGGLWMCGRTQARIGDPKLGVLGYIWLAKLALTFALLYIGWIPQLYATIGSWGYDPQRYYTQAYDLIEQNWVADYQVLNYVGILYYYGAIFALFGHNPVIPAIVNSFTTLVAFIVLLRYTYQMRVERSSRDWLLVWTLLAPELLWYDVMTAREGVMAALLLISLLTVGSYFSDARRRSLPLVMIVFGLSATAVAAIRTTMVLPMALAVMVMALFVYNRREGRFGQRHLLVLGAALIFLAAPMITGKLGGYDFSLGGILQSTLSAKTAIAENTDIEWSQSSIGLLLVPSNPIQAIVFLPFRMVLYLASPFPYIQFSITELISGRFDTWQRLMAFLSAITNVWMVPYVIAGTLFAIRDRKRNSAPLALTVVFWSVFISITGGNVIIHDRYRIMSTMLLAGCASIGWHRNLAYEQRRYTVLWYGCLVVFAFVYVGYKYII